MQKLILFGIGMIISSPVWAVTVVVPAGETQSNGMVDSSQIQEVYGTTYNTSVLGQQVLENGGESFASNLYSYSSQTVQSGGVSNQTNVQYRAYQYVYGQSKDTTLNGGTMIVYSGGESYDTILNSGTQIVRGYDKDAQIGVGTLQRVDAGGTADGSIISGRQEVYGTAQNTLLNGGTQLIYENAIFSNGTNNNGRLYIYDYATVSDLTVNGGETLIYPNVDLSGTTVLNNASITFYDNATIDNLQMNNGHVEMFALGLGTLTLNQLNGQGTFGLTSNFSGGTNDTLIVNGGSGSFGLIVTDYSLEETMPERIHLIEQTSGSDQFYLVGGAMDAGAFEYELVHSGSEWVLQKTYNNTDSSILAKNTFSSLSSVFYTHLRNLNTRLKETHFSHEKGAWVRGINRRVELNYRDNSDADIDIWGVQGGFDLDIPQNWVDSWNVGISTAYTISNQKFDRAGHGDGYTNSLSLYSILMNSRHQYLDLIGSYYHHRQKLTTYMPSGLSVVGSYRLNGWSVSAEIGQRFLLQDSWFIEPQLQATYMWLDDVSYRTTYNTLIKGEDQDSLLGRLGVMGGKRVENMFSFPFSAFFKTGLLREFRNESKVSVAGHTFHEKLDGTMVELGVGFSADINSRNSFYFNADTYMGSDIRVLWDLNIGFRHNF